MGQPPWLVVLPGMDGTGDLLTEFATAATASFRVRVQPYPPDVALGYEALAERLVAALPREPFVLLGESFGGPLALLLAARCPPALRAVVLCASFARYPLPVAALAPLARWAPVRCAPLRVVSRALLGRWETAPLRGLLALALAKVRPAVFRARLAAAARVDTRDALHQVSVPILYLQASADRVVPSRAAAEIEREARVGVTRTRVDGPHFLLQAAPGNCARVIAAFAAPLL